MHIRDERDIKEFENLVDEAEGFTAEYIETVISEDLQRLNPLQNGLGNDATEYVLHGERSWCLKAIEAIAPVQTLEVLLLHSSVQQKTHQRRMLLLNCASAQLDLVKRYAEVLAAIAGGDLENAPGGDAVPVIARVFFGELFLVIADGKRVGANRNLMKADDVPGLDTARQFLVHLGCSEVDTIDLLYTKSKRRGEANAAVWRRLIDVKPILADAPEDLVVSATRMLPAARKVLVLDFVRMGLGTTPSALSFLLEQCAVSTKGINLLAMKALRHVPSETLEPLAAEKLVNGNIGVRTAMVEVLITIGTPSARAVLRAHAGNEKSARIVSAIKKVIGADEILEQDRTLDKQNGYLALDKTFIDIPTLVVQKDVPLPSFGDSDVAELREHIRLENAWRKKHNETRAKQAHGETLSLLDPSTADELVAVFSEPMAAEPMSFLTHDLSSACASWIQEALAKMPDTAAMHLCTCFDRAIISRSLTTYGYSTPVQTRVSEFLWSPDGDLRLLDSRQNLACSAAEKVDVNSSSHPVKQTELKLTGWLSTNSSQLLFDKLAELPRKVVWPYLATHLHVFDEALGLRPSLTHKFDLQMTLAMLSLLPAVPERLFDSLMVIATGSSPTCRKQARELLAELPELEARLIDLLDDRRQQMRASVADWLGESGSVASVTALKARIVKEKQPIVRVAVLEALDKLACDSADLFRPVALLEEAEKGLKQTKLEKLTWLFLDQLPETNYLDGTSVPVTVLRYWMHLAVKLKEPGGNRLFDLYLDRLEPQSAEVFSAWVLNSWIDHEFSRNDRFSANAYVNKYAPTLIEQYRLWYPDKPANEAMASLSTELLQRYQRSGATSKGLLALAFKAPPALVAKLLRSCLKSRRSSTSSTRALLELAAASAHPTTLQVIISAAKRARPMSLRKLAGELINGIAEQRGWSLDELGDRTVPDADFEPDGSLLLPCGKDRKQYFGRLDNKSKLIIFNPAGKKVASLPAGADTFTNASRQRLTNSREELAQVVEQQTVRLYEALCTEREWPVENWLRDLIGHSLMQKLAQRIIWLGFDAQGAVQASFRPTAEGDYTDAEDYLVELSDFAAIRLAHTTLLDEASNAAWIAHLAEYKIEPLLDQFERPAFLLEDSEKARAVTEIKDRKGWLMDSSTLRAEVKKLGYERTPNLVGSSFLDYRKSFGHTGWCAVINFTGFFAPRQNDKAALLDMHFEQDRWLITLGDVPAVLLSECWNDLHQIASKATYDPDWRIRTGWAR